MKLKLEYLAPYLPYGFDIIIKGKKWNVIGLSKNVVLAKNDISDEFFLNEIKPILRPLVDLAKEEYSHLLYGNPLEYKIDELPYKTFIKLLENHFDVFHLLPQELAVDINTLAQ